MADQLQFVIPVNNLCSFGTRGGWKTLIFAGEDELQEK